MESEKIGLKLNIQKTKIMVSGPITSWQIDGETMETVRDFILGGSKITADGDCSHEIKRHLHLGRKVMTNLDSVLKSRNITFSTRYFRCCNRAIQRETRVSRNYQGIFFGSKITADGDCSHEIKDTFAP